MRVLLIVNPTAGRGHARMHESEVVESFRDGGVDPEVVRTTCQGDAERIAIGFPADRYDVVVAVGGDGTVHEVAAGLAGRTGDRPDLAVVPVGSGNDFAKVLRMPMNPKRAVKTLLAATSRPIDLGRVVVEESGRHVERPFINAVGIGFDAMVAVRSRNSRKIRGVIGYLAVALRTLLDWEHPRMTVELGGIVIEDELLFVTAGNGTCSGGGFYLTPAAEEDDGELDVCVVHGRTLPRLLALLPRAMAGKHVGAPGVTYEKVRRLTVRCDPVMPVHADGEIVSNKAVGAVIEVIPGALRVRAPRRASR